MRPPMCIVWNGQRQESGWADQFDYEAGELAPTEREERPLESNATFDDCLRHLLH